MRVSTTVAAVVAVAAALACGAPTAVTAKSDVVTLTASSFKKEVLNSDGYWMVEFYAPWCGHCKALAPEWEKAATQVKDVARLGAVDATVHTNLAQQYEVRGYPTVLEFGKDKKNPKPYQGQREAGPIAQHVRQAAKGFPPPSGGSVTEVLFSTMYSFLSTNSRMHEHETKVLYLHEVSGDDVKGDAEDDSLSKKKKAKKPAKLKTPKWFSQLSGKVQKAVDKKAKAAPKGEKLPKIEFGVGATKNEALAIVRHLGIEESQLPAVVALQPVSNRMYTLFEARESAKGDVAAMVRAALRGNEDGDLTEAHLPSFPTASQQRRMKEAKKVAKAAELTPDNAEKKCFGKDTPSPCAVVFASDPKPVADKLANKFKNDAITVVYSSRDGDHARHMRSSFDLEEGSDYLVVVKTGKRGARAVSYALGADGDGAESGIESVLGGDARFTRVEKLPNLAGGGEDEDDEVIELGDDGEL